MDVWEVPDIEPSADPQFSDYRRIPSKTPLVVDAGRVDCCNYELILVGSLNFRVGWANESNPRCSFVLLFVLTFV